MDNHGYKGCLHLPFCITYPPNSISFRRSFVFFLPFQLDKIKVGGDFCYPHILKVSSPTVLNVVTSTLHHKAKFMLEEKVVIVYGEEEHIISHLASLRYTEVEGKVHETPFQAFEAVLAIKIPR